MKKDRPGDPRLGAIGGSYGGGYQFLGAFEELRLQGKPVFDALAPEITWHDLAQSLAPSGVVRTEWALALSAASLPSDALPPTVYKALVEGAALGTLPDGSVPGTENLAGVLREERPALARPPRPPARHPGAVRPGHDRHPLPAPAGAGATGTRRSPEGPQEEHLRRLQRRPRAARRSCPQGVNVTSDPCSQQLAGGDFEALTMRFFDEQLKRQGDRPHGYGKMHLATPGSSCLTVRRRPRRHGVPDRHGRARRRPPARRWPPDRRRADRGRRLALRHRQGDLARPGHPGLLRPGRRHQRRSTPSWCRTTCCRCARSTPVTGQAPRSRCRRWPSRCPRGSRCSCSPPRSATPSSAWAAAPPGLITLDGHGGQPPRRDALSYVPSEGMLGADSLTARCPAACAWPSAPSRRRGPARRPTPRRSVDRQRVPQTSDGVRGERAAAAAARAARRRTPGRRCGLPGRARASPSSSSR